MTRAVAKAALAAAALLLAAAPLAAHGDHAAGVPGDPNKPARTVEIVMSEAADGMHYTPDRVEAHPGEQIRFAIRNAGSVSHEFFLGTAEADKAHAAMMAAMPEMKHHDANAVTVAPGQSATLLWRFTHAGDFEFACLVPGHYEAGMHGAVAVK
ncbi:putative cupredoxin-like copper-binding protein [Roseiarcus fermentans]|uniref:Putative cupredoxin-like copper-binding protein n=1 Tax=Roseiarcus fermentans TaxID=1473586 RepID=A0A366F4M1_9HYPH|nr:plastocyanin/azurin family copper-binding protein [Roseiarcus fermentans]RBP09096.1 putative cupredoxin-like copper-binding protein [Roseiarcus fermentans]